MSATRRELLFGSAGALAGLASGQSPARRPNVLFVFSDQQQARTVSAYGPTPVRTPNIDRIAAQGCRFDNAISIYPVCSPFRGMLMSGLYPMRNGVVGNDTPLSDGLPTLGKLFRQAGYHTGYIGKWHLESTRTGFVPHSRRQGFDDFWAVHSCNHDHFDSPYYMEDPERELTHPGYEPDSQTKLAIDFARKSVQGGAPFCLAVSFGPPHNPYKAPAGNEARFQPEDDIPLPPNVQEHAIVDELLRTDTRPLTPAFRRQRERARARLTDDARIRREILRGYYGACEALDACVGRLLASLAELGVADDTIVVYTSDHGDMAGAHRMSLKQLPFEESIRVPFVIRYPRRITAGGVTQTLLSPVDILPTLLSLSGIGFESERFDGRDLSAAATAAAGEQRGSVPIMKMVHGGNPWIQNGVRPWRGVRTQRHTYAELEGEPWILFDNQEDPYQMANLVADPGHAALSRKLQADMQAGRERSGDTLTEAQIDSFRHEQRRKFPGLQ
ncbi:MAG: sulfatase [Bryobacterales bacterium]|nr:sulfatase [Bryobacterales bacterium]